MKRVERLMLIGLMVFPAILALAAGGMGDSGKNPGSLHGDTSIPDEVLIKQYGNKIPTEVLMDGLSKKMPPVKFPHKKHVDQKVARCGNCHHENPKDLKPCSKCHSWQPENVKAPKYDKAHHNLCVACHKTKQKPDPNAPPGDSKKTIGPPIKCNDCHKKENKPALPK